MLENAPEKAQRMYNRFNCLSMQSNNEALKEILSGLVKDDEDTVTSAFTKVNDIVTQVMHAICAHYPINHPGAFGGG